MSIGTAEYGGHEVVQLEAGEVRLMVTTAVGPRVLALLAGDRANAFAELPDVTLPCPGSEPFHLYGGHRLWAAPEEPRITYRPDDDAVDVALLEDGVRLRTRPDAVARTSRQIIIRTSGPERFSLEHRIVNEGEAPRRLAVWAITMMAPLGRAWLPTLTDAFDPGGFQAQRNIVLWPYSRNDDPRFVLHEHAIELRAAALADRSISGPFKVGSSLRRGWVAHWREGVLLVKRAVHDESREYADMGASGQLYSRGDASGEFTELETLGALTDLAPGEAAVHREDWEVHLVDEVEAERLVASGELDG